MVTPGARPNGKPIDSGAVLSEPARNAALSSMRALIESVTLKQYARGVDEFGCGAIPGGLGSWAVGVLLFAGRA